MQPVVLIGCLSQDHHATVALLVAAHRSDVQQIGRIEDNVHRHADQSDAGLHFAHTAAHDSGDCIPS